MPVRRRAYNFVRMSAVLAAARRWVFPPAPDTAAVDRLSLELRLPPTLCRLLVHRGYGASDAARGFLRPHPDHIHPPTLLAGMGDAVARLRRAIDGGETVLVHGDYDVDGICSTALYVRALRMMGAKAEPFVPRRLVDGYDLSEAGVRGAVDLGATLILTCDCGIVAHDAMRRARAAGIDVIVTDHHTPGPELPDAIAVVNPNRGDCGYPDKGLAGVGVAWKVCCALAEEIGFPQERLHAFLDLVAVATIADIAPLRGENRAMVRWGLQRPPADAQRRPARPAARYRAGGPQRDHRVAGGLRPGAADQRGGADGRGAARRAPAADGRPARGGGDRAHAGVGEPLAAERGRADGQ